MVLNEWWQFLSDTYRVISIPDLSNVSQEFESNSFLVDFFKYLFSSPWMMQAFVLSDHSRRIL